MSLPMEKAAQGAAPVKLEELERLAYPGRAVEAPDPRIDVDRLKFLWETHRNLTHHVRFSDMKAGAVVVVASSVTGALFKSGAHGPLAGFSPLSLTTWVAVSAYALLICSVLCGFWSIHPRLVNSRLKDYIFFGGIANYESPQAYWQALLNDADSKVAETLAQNVYYLARIVSEKYRWVAMSAWSAFLGSLIAGGMLALT
jgi:hypothetical protein